MVQRKEIQEEGDPAGNVVYERELVAIDVNLICRDAPSQYLHITPMLTHIAGSDIGDKYWITGIGSLLCYSLNVRVVDPLKQLFTMTNLKKIHTYTEADLPQSIHAHSDRHAYKAAS